MAQVAFFLRFREQLRRTRQNLVPGLEDMATKAIREAGGEIVRAGGSIRARFSEDAPGFWLDMLLLTERLARIADGAAASLHGHAILVGEGSPAAIDQMCRLFSGGFFGGGAFLDAKSARALKPYVTVERQGAWAGGEFFKLKGEKVFVSPSSAGFSLQEGGARLFEPGLRPSVLVMGRSYEGRRESLYRRVASFANLGVAGKGRGIPPLFVRFGDRGLCAIADAWPGWMAREDADAGEWERLAAMREFFLRHRLRKEPSPFAARMAREYFDALLAMHARRAEREGARPAAILENVHLAEPAAMEVAIGALSARQDFVVVGLCAGKPGGAAAAKWEAFFPRAFCADGGKPPGSAERQAPDLPPDLWEMGYVCALLRRVFPPGMVPEVLGEMGKSPGMISRAISLLHALGAFDTPLDPQPWSESFLRRAEAALGEKKDALRLLARERLLAWVARGKISPCVGLLEKLAGLGGGAADEALILRSIHGDLACSDGAELRKFADSCKLKAAVGQPKERAVRHVAKTLLALHFGDASEAREAFEGPPPECSSFPLLKTQSLLSQALCHLGWRDGGAAARAVKEATLLCQKSGHSWLARCHRLFALASLSQRRIGETNEYLGLALENAAKSGESQEIGISFYYGAAAQLLHGNLSRARTMAKRALGHFLQAGSPEWADRSRFLEGRIAFENGNYDLASVIFGDTRASPHGLGSPEKNGLLEAWEFRAGVYAMKFPPCPRNRAPDADLFELEALCFREDFSRMAELAEELAAAPVGDDVFYGTEQADWRSGFFQCELLCCSWRDFRDRMLGAYRSIAQSHSPRGGKAAVSLMQRILQNGCFAEFDPGDAFYHYAFYKVLRQTGAGNIDLRTAASKAHQRLQVRAWRIENPEIRREYLALPYWNKALEQTARELKLV